MATIINMGSGSGSISPVLLASLTSVPTSITAISGTENWKKYDAIYYEFTIRIGGNQSIFTNLILTDVVSLGNEYFLSRVTSTNTGAGDYVTITCVFSENEIKLKKGNHNYDITKLNIYGVNF